MGVDPRACGVASLRQDVVRRRAPGVAPARPVPRVPPRRDARVARRATARVHDAADPFGVARAGVAGRRARRVATGRDERGAPEAQNAREAHRPESLHAVLCTMHLHCSSAGSTTMPAPVSGSPPPPGACARPRSKEAPMKPYAPLALVLASIAVGCGGEVTALPPPSAPVAAPAPPPAPPPAPVAQSAPAPSEPAPPPSRR